MKHLRRILFAARLHAIAALFMFAVITCFISCKKEKPVAEDKFGKVSFVFTHQVQGSDLVIDTMIYVNAAGNPYLVNEIQYFITDVTLHRGSGSPVVLNQWDDMHYFDTDIPSTLKWDVPDDVPAGSYDYISFTFGIPADKNHSFMFVNPPERDMFWPEYLGGGYHYLKLNGKWQDTAGIVRPFDFHLGIGQTYASGVIDVDSITGFVQNYFNVTLPASSFTIAENERREIQVVMNVESWFESPHVYDHNQWGGAIMQNQPAMQIAKENGIDVFGIGHIY